MLRKRRVQGRRGTILPLLAVSLVALFACVALAIDVGRLAVAQAECQNAADLAAIAGVRTINTGSSGNLTSATTNAQNAAIANKILGQALAASEIAVTHGAYHYTSSTQSLRRRFPRKGAIITASPR